LWLQLITVLEINSELGTMIEILSFVRICGSSYRYVYHITTESVILGDILKEKAMFRNYLKVTLRNGLKNKTYSVINIFGLAIGLAASIVMGIYIHFESSFDQFHINGNDIYRLVLMNESYTGEGIAKIYTPAGPSIKEEIPEIEAMVRLVYFGRAIFKVGDKVVAESNGLCVDDDFFELFDFKIISGNTKRGLRDPNSLIITQSLAIKYFGNDDPLGKTILVRNSAQDDQPYQIVALVEDPPVNSHFNFSFLAPIESVSIVPLDDWNRVQAYTYLKIKPGSSGHPVSWQDCTTANISKEFWVENAALFRGM